MKVFVIKWCSSTRMGAVMKKVMIKLIVIILSCVFILPIILTVVNSFSTNLLINGEYRQFDIIPKGFSIIGYYDLLIENLWFIRGFWNSVFYAMVITVFNLVISLSAAYAFHEASFPGKGILYFFYIVLMMMPLQVSILPNYIGLRDMKLIDTPWAILLPGIFAPFGVFLMCQYMRGLDSSIVESARLETKSVIRILLYIIVPQVKACVIALFVFTFAENWNMVKQPNIFLKNINLMPLSVLLAVLENVDVMILLAGSVIFMLPIIILYMYFHDSLETGLESLKI